MLSEKLKQYQLWLASASPRRRLLLENLGLQFEVISVDIDEVYPDNLLKSEIALYIAEAKSLAFPSERLFPNSLVITADTIVCHKDLELGKPKDRKEAFEMLKVLSDDKHEVITGVCLRSPEKIISFTAVTEVWFKSLSAEEMAHYIDVYKPFDKAGAYGIQEWIGYIGVTKIKGSYFNVMGLPVQRLYEELLRF